MWRCIFWSSFSLQETLDQWYVIQIKTNQVSFILLNHLCNTGQPENSDQQTDYEAYEYDDYEDEVLTTIGKQVF